jgi:hypothetical protein
MTILDNYNSFSGRHWETGSIHNALAYQGIKAPHTGKAYSEEFLLGMSGGINFGYFTFHYSGLPPQLAVLTRNTFDPFQTILERLGSSQEVFQTSTAKKGLSNLIQILEEGKAAIAWADAYSLPYEASKGRADYWAMQPIVVYGIDDSAAWIADRAAVPLQISTDDLEKARARVKKDKFRVISLEAPNEGKLVSSVNMAIWQCIRIFTEAPPRGTRNNFGLSAYENWSKMLTNTRNKQSWTRFYPAGSGHFSAIAGHGPFPGLLDAIFAWGDRGAERTRYPKFLSEAALLLENPKLEQAAEEFLNCSITWQNLAAVLGTKELPSLFRANELITKRNELFISQGASALEQIKAINAELSQLEIAWPQNEGSDPDAIAAHRLEIQEAVDQIHAVETKAIRALTEAMS